MFCLLLCLVACSVTTITDRYLDIMIEVEYESKIYRGQTTVRYHKYEIEGSVTPESNGIRTKVIGNVPHVSVPGVGMIAVPFKGESDDRPAVLHRWIASALKADDKMAKRFIMTWTKEVLDVPVDAITEYLVIRGTAKLDSFSVLTPGETDSVNPRLLSLKLRVSDSIKATSSIEEKLPFLIKHGEPTAVPNLNLPSPLWSLR